MGVIPSYMECKGCIPSQKEYETAAVKLVDVGRHPGRFPNTPPAYARLTFRKQGALTLCVK